MKKTRVLQEIRHMRFTEIYKQRTEGKLTVEQAADILGINERTFRRWVSRYKEEGEEGLADRRLDRAAHNTAPTDEVIEIVTLFQTRYSDFTVSHFYDKYRMKHEGERSYTWVKTCLQEAGLVRKAKKRGAHRRKRPRKAEKGIMLHQDASSHEWIEDTKWDLIITMDDADNEIYSGFFVEEEGTWSSFQGVSEVIVAQGLFCSLYTDRGSHYFYTPEVGGKVDLKQPTQFGRAMQQLGIEHIAAYSPEARGRSERMFGTLQGRLPQELKQAEIRTIEEANKFLQEVFIPEFNKRFKIKAESDGSAFIPWLTARNNLDDILCIQEQRTVSNDNTVSYKKKKLQIAKDKYRYSYAKTQVKVHEYQDGSTAIFHGPRCLGQYTATGETKDALNNVIDLAEEKRKHG